MSVLQKLTEGIVDRSLKQEGAALLEKWERTGLLEGLSNDNKKNTMARLLENQAAQLLKEASSMSAGDVEGFASVAFPIVRRVFGGLIANDLVSVQPMSLPSGLIFFMDFQHSNTRGEWRANESIYGGGVLGSQLTGGVDIGGTLAKNAEKGFYNLNNGYSSPTGSVALADGGATATAAASDGELIDKDGTDLAAPVGVTPVAISALSEAQKKTLRWDPDILAAPGTNKVYATVARLSVADMNTLNKDNMIACTLVNPDLSQLTDAGATVDVIRRLTHLGYKDVNNDIVAGSKAQYITFYCMGPTAADNDHAGLATIVFPLADSFTTADALGAVKGTDPWGLEGASNAAGAFDGLSKDVIPEIDIKVDSIAVTAITKKLKAKWTPELGQDLNAYHNLDAEVELTQILSEQIALEIDREIVNDLVQGAQAATYYWSRSPGLFVHKTLGTELGATAAAPDFTGTVSEWYETLVETINDVSAQIHRKTLRGGANFLVVSPEVANILEFTSGFRASLTADSDKGTVGAVKSGSLSKKWDVWVDPYFPRNVVLVGRRGGSFLESGYVYAPYVPLQVTPTIFGTEDFVPRKGVMTRYAKKMVRPDMYGLVIVRGLLGESGAS